MIIGSFPQSLHMIDISGTHEWPRDCRQSKKISVFFPQWQDKVLLQSTINQAVSASDHSFTKRVSPSFAPVLTGCCRRNHHWSDLLLFAVVGAPVMTVGSVLPKNPQTKKFACCHFSHWAPRNRWFKTQLAYGNSKRAAADLSRMKRRFSWLPWFLSNFKQTDWLPPRQTPGPYS